MKETILLIGLLAMFSANSKENTEISEDYCDLLAIVAENAMNLRQLGVEKSYLINKIKRHQSEEDFKKYNYTEIIDSAFEYPVSETDKDNLILGFKGDIYLKCFKEHKS